jgi:hypothetical protein
MIANSKNGKLIAIKRNAIVFERERAGRLSECLASSSDCSAVVLRERRCFFRRLDMRADYLGTVKVFNW